MSTYLFSYIHAVFNLETLPARSCVIIVCIVYSICRKWNTHHIFVTFPTQFVMLQKLTELSLSLHYATLFLGFELLDFV